MAEHEECRRAEYVDYSYGIAGRMFAVCETHTYFGNGVEPNGWPCDPSTRTRTGSVGRA